MDTISDATGLLNELRPAPGGKACGGPPTLSGEKIFSKLGAMVRTNANITSSHLTILPGVNHGIEQDGRVAVLTVKRL